MRASLLIDARLMTPAAAPASDVLVVGAGILGLSTAWGLLQAVLRVRVIESAAVGPGGASWAGGGILAPLEPETLDAAATQRIAHSLALYPDWIDALRSAGGIDPEYRVCGLRVLEPLPRQDWTQWAASAGLHVQQDAAGLLIPGVAQVRSPRLLRLLAAAVRARGGLIHEHERVLEVLGQPRVQGLRTDRAEYRAAAVVVCAGAWSDALLPAPRIEPVKGEMLLFQAEPGELPHILMREGMYLIPRADGAVIAGSTLVHSGFECEPSASGRALILDAVRGLSPALAARPVMAHWAGLRTAPRDGVLRIGAVPGRPGLFLNAGQHRLGITLAPGSAKALVAELIATLT
jgi:glycine oxidase